MTSHQTFWIFQKYFFWSQRILWHTDKSNSKLLLKYKNSNLKIFTWDFVERTYFSRILWYTHKLWYTRSIYIKYSKILFIIKCKNWFRLGQSWNGFMIDTANTAHSQNGTQAKRVLRYFSVSIIKPVSLYLLYAPFQFSFCLQQLFILVCPTHVPPPPHDNNKMKTNCVEKNHKTDFN